MFQTTPKSLRLSKISRLFETCTRNYLFFFFNSCSRARTLARVERKNDSDRLFKHSFNSNFVESASRSHRKILQKNGVIASLYKQCTVYEKRSEKSFCPSLSSDRYLLDFPQRSAYYLKKKREREKSPNVDAIYFDDKGKQTAEDGKTDGVEVRMGREGVSFISWQAPGPIPVRAISETQTARAWSPMWSRNLAVWNKQTGSRAEISSVGNNRAGWRSSPEENGSSSRISATESVHPFRHGRNHQVEREREREREREDRWYRQPVHHRLHPDTIPTGRSLWKPDTCWSGLPSNRTSTHRISAPSTPPTCRFSVVRCPFVRDVSPLLAPSVYLLRSGLSLWSMTRASFVSRGFALKGWIIIERYTKITRR